MLRRLSETLEPALRVNTPYDPEEMEADMELGGRWVDRWRTAPIVEETVEESTQNSSGATKTVRICWESGAGGEGRNRLLKCGTTTVSNHILRAIQVDGATVWNPENNRVC